MKMATHTILGANEKADNARLSTVDGDGSTAQFVLET